jgi:trehalose 6-phosphate phosphatase
VIRRPGAPDSAAVLLDFDGTLASIVDDPEEARPLPGVAAVLGDLASRYRLVAVVSGRPGSFLAAHLDVPGVDRWGAYGLEHVVEGGVEVVPEAVAWQPRVSDAVARARATAPAGVGVEDKGVTVTIHYRADPAREGWVRRFAAAVADETGLSVHDAKMSVELRPPLAIDKGTVVARLVAEAGVGWACYIGDDIGDLDAFRALDAVPAAVRVAVRSAETPAALLAAADEIVDGPGGALALLRSLVP